MDLKGPQTYRERNQICGYQEQGIGGGGIGERWSKGTNFQL